MKISKKYKVLLLITWLGLIFYMSSQVATTSSGMSRVFVAPVQLYTPGLTEDSLTMLVRKSAHMFLYFVLGVLVFNLLRDYDLGKSRLVSYSLLFAFSYAISDEIHQSFVSGRSSEFRDVIVDTIGAILGIVTFYIIFTLRNSRKTLSCDKQQA